MHGAINSLIGHGLEATDGERGSPGNDSDMPSGGSHLRSTDSITGYHIETPDGGRGRLVDFIIDDETWHIKYLVIEMHS